LLSVLPRDRRRQLRPNADRAALVDNGALGGDAPADIGGGQNRRYPSTARCMFFIYRIYGLKISRLTCRFELLVSLRKPQNGIVSVIQLTLSVAWRM
jgi:hypothetical protein